LSTASPPSIARNNRGSSSSRIWVLGYSSATFYGAEGTTEEPMGRESLQSLWQKYKVDIAIYGHVHGYERTCPVYEVMLVSSCFSI
jgi:predicted phosphodiesterase